MRLIPVLLIALAVTFAGCAKKADDGAGTTTSTTTTPGGSSTTSSSSSTTSSTTTTSTTPPTNTTTTPVAVAPMQLCKPSNDYGQAQPDSNNPGSFTPVKKTCGEVAAGYTTITLSGNFTNAAGQGLLFGSGIDVKVVGPDGKTAVATCSASPTDMAPFKCSKSGAISVPGTYSVIYDGGGLVSFAGSVDIA